MVYLRVFGAGKIAGWGAVGLGSKRLRREVNGVVCRGGDGIPVWVEGSSGGGPRRLVLLSLFAFRQVGTAAPLLFISVPRFFGRD